jgi:hypothetical protein
MPRGVCPPPPPVPQMQRDNWFISPYMPACTRAPAPALPVFAPQVWKLSSTDLCEVARTGVLHSGFPHACKKHWVGSDYWRPGPEGNDIHKTNVPSLRMRFRWGGSARVTQQRLHSVVSICPTGLFAESKQLAQAQGVDVESRYDSITMMQPVQGGATLRACW